MAKPTHADEVRALESKIEKLRHDKSMLLLFVCSVQPKLYKLNICNLSKTCDDLIEQMKR